jgi:hypothetical protein
MNQCHTQATHPTPPTLPVHIPVERWEEIHSDVPVRRRQFPAPPRAPRSASNERGLWLRRGRTSQGDRPTAACPETRAGWNGTRELGRRARF